MYVHLLVQSYLRIDTQQIISFILFGKKLSLIPDNIFIDKGL